MSWQAAPGCTLLVPSGPGKHLHVVVLGPVVVQGYGTAPQVAMVSVTSKRPGIHCDAACEIAPGEHEFVQRESYVAYRYLRIDAEAHAAKLIGDGIWTAHAPCSAALFERIRAGVCASQFTRGEFRQLFGC